MKTQLVLLHGLLCDATVWTHQVASLSTLAEVHVVDYGELDSLAAMARHVLDRIDAPRLAIAGHSMGGRVAMEMARIAPGRIERLALLDTSWHPLPEGEAGEAERAGRMRLLALAREQGMRAMASDWTRGMVHPDRVDGPVFDAVVDMVARKSPAIYAAQIRAMLGRPDVVPLLRGLRLPTLLLCGREDAWSPPLRHQEMQRLMPHAQLRIVDHCGHMSTMEQPSAVTEALRDWIVLPQA